MNIGLFLQARGISEYSWGPLGLWIDVPTIYDSLNPPPHIPG